LETHTELSARETHPLDEDDLINLLTARGRYQNMANVCELNKDGTWTVYHISEDDKAVTMGLINKKNTRKDYHIREVHHVDYG
jgi:hypothetical protein